MKQIYIVLTYTGTILSKIIHIYTGKNYTHSSISLDRELNKMYSFGRYNAYNPFFGGFINEKINSGTFKRFYNTKAVIYSLEITDEQYSEIENEIQKFILNKNLYRYNLLGLMAILFHKKMNRKYKFYCSEFLKHLFDEANIENNLPEITKPEDFIQLNDIKMLYKGKLNNYNYAKNGGVYGKYI